MHRGSWSARVARLTAFAVAAMAVAAPAFAQPQNNDYYDPHRDGTLLYNVEAYHIGVAEDKINDGRWAPAMQDIDFILRYYPNHPRGLMLLVKTCEAWRSGACDLERYFERAVAVNPNASTTYVVQGIALLRQGRTDPAIAALEKAVELDPGSLNAQYNLGLAYLERKDYARANLHAQKAYALGAPLPGLRDRLTRAGQWRPGAVASTRGPEPGTATAKPDPTSPRPATDAAASSSPAQ